MELRAPALVVAILLGAGFAVGSPAEVGAEVAFAPHPPILVDGDAGFSLPASGVRGGSGTPADPFRIAGWAVTGSFAHGVHLRNTTAHVVLEDLYFATEGGQVAYPAACLVVDPPCRSGTAILLDGAQNVTIRRVAVRFVATGIHVRDARDVAIVDSTLGSLDDPRPPYQLTRGLRVEESERVRLENVSVTLAFASLDLRASRDFSIVRSSFTFTAGSIVESMAGLAIRESEFLGNGLVLFGANERLSILGSSFTNGTYHLRPADNGDETLRGAFLCGNLWTGPASGRALRLPPSEDATIVGNAFEGASGAMTVRGALRARVEHNHVASSSDTEYGVSLQGDLAAHQNAFLSEGVGVNLGGVDASANWWGAPDGPSRDGPGSGTRVRLQGLPSLLAPFLDAPPVMPPEPCGEAFGPAGATGGPLHAPVGFALGARADAQGERVDVGLKIRAGDGIRLP